MRKKFPVAIWVLLFLFSSVQAGVSLWLFPSMQADTGKGYTLQELIDIGLENSPQVAAKAQEMNARHAAYKATKRLMNPELSFAWGKAESYDELVQRNTSEFSISQPLENPFKRHYRIQVFERDWEASQYLLEFTKLELMYEIKYHFYQILLQKKKTELAKKNADSIAEIHRLILKRAQLGEVKELEAIKLQVESLRAQNALNKIWTDLELAKERLNKFLGNTLPLDFDIQGKLEYIPIDVNEEVLLAEILPKHPLIKEKEKKNEQAEENIRFVKWKLLPDFKLVGFSKKELDGRNKGLGISFDIPLWNWRTKEVDEAESLLLKQNQELRTVKMELATEAKAMINQLRLSARTLKLFTTGLLKHAEESLKIAEVSYTHGEISLIDFLDSQRTYFSIMTDYQDSLYAWNADRAALERVIGEELQ
jgi:cobalt-zinc-cadmium efflux system outer membrane protein